MSKLNLNEEQSTGNIRIPKGNYKLRILEEPEFKLTKQKEGKQQYPMLVFKFEVVEPATKIIAGQEVTVAGEELMLWCVIFNNEKPDGTTEESCKNLAAIHRQANLPLDLVRDENSGLPVDENGVPISYKGIIVDAKCDSEEYIEQDDEGNPMTNPLTGEIQKGWNRKIKQVW